jgi:hypothetical protein
MQRKMSSVNRLVAINEAFKSVNKLEDSFGTDEDAKGE